MVILIISFCTVAAMVVALALCSCWKRERHKNEWIGLHGMVTQKNPDENVNHLPSVTLQSSHVNNSDINAVALAPAGDEDDNSKRATLQATNTRRSLPDIPLEPGNRVDSNNTSTWVEPTSDNLSELYATVGQYQNSAKRHTLPNGLETRPSISQHSSISQGDDAFSPYARVNYDKVNKKEHPYARVQNHNEQDENSSDETGLLRPSTSSQPQNEPVAPQRSRRSSTNSGVGVDIIPAATAVAGGIAANQELPYMTPPITQPNFSGDSQDSSKGYTSISVREPLANIRAQTKEINKLQRDLDPHYSTVSDDSDEMYTTIQEPNQQLYADGSETYAQIQAPPQQMTVEVEVNVPCGSTRSATLERQTSVAEVPSTSAIAHEAVPQPPTVDSLKHMPHSHSRQASSSSSVILLGSPKPEKRQANSPLPPPPPTSASPDAPRSPISKSIDDMYAKVYKNRNKSKEESLDQALNRDSERSSFHSARKISSNSGPLPELEEDDTTDSAIVEDKKRYVRKEHDYETLKKQQSTHGDYQRVRGDDDCDSEPGYASINGPDSLADSDPGYEVLKKQETSSEIDPNYEQLRHGAREDEAMDGYSVINKQRKMEERRAKGRKVRQYSGSDEPNYESVPNDYAGALGGGATDSESDPNYESVNQGDPNYESVKYLDVNDPPYERLNDDNSGRTDDVNSLRSKDHSGTIDSSNSSDKRTTELPYEPLRDEISKTDSDSSDYERIRNSTSDRLRPDYETIKPKSLDSSNNSKEEPHYDTVNREKSGTSTSEDLPNSDEDIFEV